MIISTYLKYFENTSSACWRVACYNSHLGVGGSEPIEYEQTFSALDRFYVAQATLRKENWYDIPVRCYQISFNQSTLTANSGALSLAWINFNPVRDK